MALGPDSEDHLLARGLLVGIRGGDVLELIAAQLAVADLIVRPAAPPRTPGRTYETNESLWGDAAGSAVSGPGEVCG